MKRTTGKKKKTTTKGERTDSTQNLGHSRDKPEIETIGRVAGIHSNANSLFIACS